MLDPRIIANAVLARAERVSRALTNLDMQKMVYLLHGYFLTTRGKPLVKGDFAAWEYGPVHPALYQALRAYGDAYINKPLTRLDPVRREQLPVPKLDDPEVEDFLDATLPAILKIPTFKLVQITHADGTPWSRTMEAGEMRANVGMVISPGLIAEHFERHVFAHAAVELTAA